jgi:transcriptional regulator with XRE-family HTH domain
MTKIIQIKDLKQLGAIVRVVRKSQHLRQDEVGRLSHTLIGDLEAGKPTAQIGKVIAALRELGIRLHVELPAGMDIPAGLREPMK